MNALALYLAALGAGSQAEPAHDLARFPPGAMARANTLFADRYVDTHLKARLGVYSWKDDLVGEAMRQATRGSWAWYHLAQAHDAASPAEARACLERLRENLGDRDYYAGRMPPPVPLWALTMVGE